MATFDGSAGADTFSAATELATDIAVFRNLGAGDQATGGAGNDRFSSTGKGSVMDGGGGNDGFFVTLETRLVDSRGVAISGARDTIDGGAGQDSLVVTASASQLTQRVALEIAKLAAYTAGGSGAARFTSDIFRVDMTSIEKSQVRLDGVLQDSAALAGSLLAGPRAGQDSYTGTEDLRVTVTSIKGLLANDTAAAGGLKAVAGTVATAQGGSAAIAADGSFVYTAATHFSGSDRFDYTVTDLLGRAATSTVTLQIAPVNHTVTGTVSIGGEAIEGRTLTASSLLADADGLGTIVYQWQADGVAISGATDATLTLGAALVGKAVSVVASYVDGRGAAESMASSATAAVVARQAPSIISGDLAGTVTEDGAAPIVAGSLVVHATDAAQESFAAPASLAGQYGGFAFDAATGAWSYSLDNSLAAVQALTAADQVTDILSVTSLDGTSTADIIVTIGGADDQATISGDIAGAVAAAAVAPTAAGSVVVQDADANQAVFASPGGLAGQYGSFGFDATTGAWSYTLDTTLAAVQALTAADQVTDYLLVSSADGSASETVTIIVTGADDAATITGDAAGTVAAADPAPTAAGTLFVSDPDAGQAGFAVPGTLAGQYGSFAFGATTGAWSYVLDPTLAAVQALTAADHVQDALTVTSLDGTASEAIVVTVTGADDLASISGDLTATVEEDGAVQTAAGTLFVADPDAGQAAFAMPASLDGWFGSFTFDATTGAWSYVLDNSLARVQSLTATAPDYDFLAVTSLDGTATENIIVSITGADDLASIAGNLTATVAADAATPTASGTLTVSDLDSGQAGFAAPASTAGWYGSFGFDAATGAWTYVLDASQPDVQALSGTATLIDFLPVTSVDGTAAENIIVTITATDWII